MTIRGVEVMGFFLHECDFGAWVRLVGLSLNHPFFGSPTWAASVPPAWREIALKLH